MTPRPDVGVDVDVVRFENAGGCPIIGVRSRDGVHPLAVQTNGHLLRLSLADLRTAVEDGLRTPPLARDDIRVLSFVDGRTEVWAAGVTYLRSKRAREQESRKPSVYADVYNHDRPELFFKSPAWRVVTDLEPISVRADSSINIPEPELGLVLSARGDILGYTVCNDVSSRSIEGENPLFLPQAKIFDGSCAVASSWRPWWTVSDPYSLRICVELHRDGECIWSDSTSTSLLHRDLLGLAKALVFELAMPDGALLATGTCLVPSLDVTLCGGDVVRIEIEGVGTLENRVEQRPPAALPISLRDGRG